MNSSEASEPRSDLGLAVFQMHQNAWPFMEPVKKTEAPGYYQSIRFPMGMFSIQDSSLNQLKLAV